jgi:GT2 family glycosyltransferase
VDNGSTDDSLKQLRTACAGRSRIIALKKNLGFAGGMNCGLREALSGGYEFVWLLNNDAFAEPECLNHLVAALLEDTKLATVTPLLYGSNGEEQHAGARVDLSVGTQEMLSPREMERPIPAGCWLTGTALLFRMEALRRTGLFDSAFFAYWEEVDLCIRLARNGYRLRAVPAARCFHLGSGSTGGGDAPFASYMIARNAWRFLRKHLAGIERIAALMRLTAYHLEEAETHSLKGRKGRASAIFNGTLAGAAGRYGPPSSFRCPAVIERLALAHSWAVTRFLRLTARFLRPASNEVIRRPEEKQPCVCSS